MSNRLFRRKQLWKQAEAEAEIVMEINKIACKYNCKIRFVDFKRQVVDFHGDSKNEMDCTMAIEKYIKSVGEELF